MGRSPPTHLQRLGVSLRVDDYPFVASDLPEVWRAVFGEGADPRADAVRLLLTVAMPVVNEIEEALACEIPAPYYQPSSGYFGAVVVELALSVADQLARRLYRESRGPVDKPGAGESPAPRTPVRRYDSPARLVLDAVVLAVHWYAPNYMHGDWATDPTLHTYHRLRAELNVDAPLGVGRKRFSAGEVMLNSDRRDLCDQLKLPVYVCDREVYRAVQELLASKQWQNKVDTLRDVITLYHPRKVWVRGSGTSRPSFDHDDVDVEYYFPRDDIKCVFDVLQACDYSPGGPLVSATRGVSPLVVCMCLLGNAPRCAAQAARIVLTFSTRYAPAPAARHDHAAAAVLGCLAWFLVDARRHVVPNSITPHVVQAYIDYCRCA